MGIEVFGVADIMAQFILPMLQKYYESEEGQQELAAWKEQRDSKQSENQ